MPIRLAGLARCRTGERRDLRFLVVREPEREHCLLLASLGIRASSELVRPEGWRWPADPLLRGFPVTAIVWWCLASNLAPVDARGSATTRAFVTTISKGCAAHCRPYQYCSLRNCRASCTSTAACATVAQVCHIFSSPPA